MRAIQISSRTDKKGKLKIDYQLNKSESDVRILILLDDNNNEMDEEKLWLDSMSKNSTFDFLNDEAEDIYSLNDGELFND